MDDDELAARIRRFGKLLVEVGRGGVVQRKRQEPYEFAALARYNNEVMFGIVHTPEYDAFMRSEQVRFDAQPPEER